MTLAGPLLALVLAGLEVRLQPGSARPGDAVLVEVTGATEAPSGQLGSAELVFLPFLESWVALVGLSVERKPGPLSLLVTGKGAERKEQISGTLEVRKPEFRRRQLTVNRRFTNPSRKERQRAASDQKAFDETRARLQKDGLLDKVKLTNSKMVLERWEDVPVWKVTFWAEKARNPSQTVDVGQIFVHAEDGKVVNRDLHINRVD